MREIFFSKRENPKMRKNKVFFRIFGAAISILLFAVFFVSCTKETEKNQPVDPSLPTSAVVETYPANRADTVVVNPVVTVTLKSAIIPSETSASVITLKQGTDKIQGTVSISGTKATFTPSTDLKPGTTYTVTISTTVKDGSVKVEHTWTFTTGKNRHEGDSGIKALLISSVIPQANATQVPVTIQPAITFKDGMSSNAIKSLKITLSQGTTDVSGTITYSGKTATFKPSVNLLENTAYTVTVTSVSSGKDDKEDEKEEEEDDDHHSSKTFSWTFTTAGGGTDTTAPTVLSVIPANNAISVANNSKISAVFSEAMNSSTITTSTFTLKQGTTAVTGTVSYSGTTATFTPSSSLTANTVYTGTITTGAKDAAGNALASNFTWSFTTAGTTDITPPTVLSVVPANAATSVSTTGNITATFSEAMNSSTITSSTFTLKQGTTAVAGTVTYSGTTATFTPSASLMTNTVYTGTITTGAKDAAGNALASNFTWSFTTSGTADVTPPTVLSVVPANAATSIAVNSNITATFSEAMNSTTITSSTFTLKQGTTAIAGTVSYSGTTATFNPTNDLAGNLVYTATITTGAKDAAGNALVSNYTWSFTTVAVAPPVSFASQVFPIVQNKCMPCHSGTSPSGGISLTNYTQVKAIGNRLDNPGMYTKMGVTTAEQALIKQWLAQGSLNN